MKFKYRLTEFFEKVDQKEQELKAKPRKRSRLATRLDEFLKKVDKTASDNQKDNKPGSCNHSDDKYNI